MSSKREVGIRLLRKGYSYSQIRKILAVSKSSINNWFKQLSKKDQDKIKLFRVKNWRRSYLIHARRRKEKTLKEEARLQKRAASQIRSISEKELLLIGTALYWAEGNKRDRWSLQFSNSDPEMIFVMMEFFRKICRVGEKKFYMQLILHPNINGGRAINYWSKITRVSKRQFKKPYFALSKASRGLRKKTQLPYGTLQIRILDKKLTHQVYGYIEGLKSLWFKPIPKRW